MRISPLLIVLSLAQLAHANDDRYAAYAAAEMAKLPAKTALFFDGGDLASFRGGGEFARRDVVAAEGQPFGQALRMQVLKGTPLPYHVQLITPKNQAPIARGDVILAVLNVRCTASEAPDGTGTFLAHLQLGRDPWTGILSASESVPRQWTRIYACDVAPRDFAAGDVELALHLGYHAQTLEFGGVMVLNLGKGVDMTKLPYTPKTYAGREKDAPWRKAAAERIERHRKADLTITVVDAAGKPISGATVHVEMKRHAYGFGSYIESTLLQDTPDGQKYREWTRRLFNRATSPIYWADWGWANEKRRADYLGIAQWLQDNGMTTRGHVIVYPGWKFMPKEARALEKDPAAPRQRILRQVVEVVQETKRFNFDEYDVTNELRQLRDLTDILGFEGVIEWFRTARQHNASAKLAINENTILTNGGKTRQEQDHYAGVIEKLMAAGVGPDVIGMQGHFGEALTPPDRLIEILDRFAKYGKPIHITEFDIDTRDEAAQGDYMRDFMTVIFSHPAVGNFTQWGFWEGRHWKPGAAMIRKDWTLKPNGEAFMNLVYKEWWTNLTMQTTAEGTTAARGFLGDYAITVTANGRSKTVPAKLTKEGTAVKVVFD